VKVYVVLVRFPAVLLLDVHGWVRGILCQTQCCTGCAGASRHHASSCNPLWVLACCWLDLYLGAMLLCCWVLMSAWYVFMSGAPVLPLQLCSYACPLRDASSVVHHLRVDACKQCCMWVPVASWTRLLFPLKLTNML
jgi:hypothetical protein